MPVELELSTLCCGETITTNQANYESDPRGVFLGETQNVGSYPPNPWGLYDTHDNVWEWCADVWHDNHEGVPTNGSAWLKEGEQSKRRGVLRNGSWFKDAKSMGSANRTWNSQDIQGICVGFRLVLSF